MIGLPVPAAGLSKAAVLPEPATSVTPAGVPFNPEKFAAVVPSKVLFAPSGNTNMCCVSELVTKVKLGK